MTFRTRISIRELFRAGRQGELSLLTIFLSVWQDEAIDKFIITVVFYGLRLVLFVVNIASELRRRVTCNKVMIQKKFIFIFDIKLGSSRDHRCLSQAELFGVIFVFVFLGCSGFIFILV